METSTEPLKKEAGVISLERFADCYVGFAIDLMGHRDTMEYGAFEQAVHESVSNRLGIPKEAVRNASNPFHWFFFCSNPESPLEYFQDTKPGVSSKSLVRKSQGYTELARRDIATKILEKYRGYFEARLRESSELANLKFA